MGEKEAESRGGKRYIVGVANRRDFFHARHDRLRRARIVPGVAPDKDAGVEWAADYERRAVFGDGRENVVQRLLLEKRVAPGKKKNIPLTEAHRVLDGQGFVDAESDGLHGAA